MSGTSETEISPDLQEATPPLWDNNHPHHHDRFRPSRYILIFTICLVLSWAIAHLSSH